MLNGLFHHYAQCLPPIEHGEHAPLSLGEGNTPLLSLRNFSAAYELPPHLQLFVKFEGANPTGSFKDRGMVVAVADARSRNIPTVICASTGNTSASAAAYAARAGLACIVLIPSGKIAAGKLAQAVAYGAHIIQIEGNFDDAMKTVRGFADDGRACVVNSINPMRLQGQKTAAFEIIQTLGSAPAYHALPVGNAGNITAHWVGYSEASRQQTAACLHCNGNCAFESPLKNATAQRPVMLGYQAAGAAPFINGNPVENPETVATAIRIGNPQSYEQARIVINESGGHFKAIADEDILHAQKTLAQTEGVFCEPASATSLAGVVADARAGFFNNNDNKQNNNEPLRIVCTLTGNGMKDPDIFKVPPVHPTPLASLPSMIADIIKQHG